MALSERLTPTWDAFHPCVFIVALIQAGHLQIDAEITKTLDAYGWLDRDGQPDYHQLNRHLNQRHQNAQPIAPDMVNSETVNQHDWPNVDPLP